MRETTHRQHTDMGANMATAANVSLIRISSASPLIPQPTNSIRSRLSFFAAPRNKPDSPLNQLANPVAIMAGTAPPASKYEFRIASGTADALLQAKHSTRQGRY